MITDDLKARIVECEQGSPEWIAARLGKVTASRVADVIAGTGVAGTRKMSGGSAGRKRYEAELICERLTGRRSEGFKSPQMDWGNECEAIARREYAFAVDTPVVTVGMVKHPTIEHAACSPDGLIGPDGIVQVKCPDTHTHIATLLGKSISGDYIAQVQWELACTGRLWCDFVSFDPRLDDPRLTMKRIRVPRDPIIIVEIEREVRSFLAELDATMTTLAHFYMSEAAQ